MYTEWCFTLFVCQFLFCPGSSSPAPPMNGTFVGVFLAFQGNSCRWGFANTPTLWLLQLTIRKSTCKYAPRCLQCSAVLISKDLQQLQGCDHKSRQSGREGSHSGERPYACLETCSLESSATQWDTLYRWSEAADCELIFAMKNGFTIAGRGIV